MCNGWLWAVSALQMRRTLIVFPRGSSSDVTGEANQCCSCLLQRWYCWQRPHTHFESVGWLSAVTPSPGGGEEGCSFFSASDSSREICPYSDVTGASRGTLGDMGRKSAAKAAWFLVDLAAENFWNKSDPYAFTLKSGANSQVLNRMCTRYGKWQQHVDEICKIPSS